MKCQRCGASLDLTQSACTACGAEVELGRLTGILGVVCRACDAYNEPGARTCAACGKPVGAAAEAAEVPVARPVEHPPTVLPPDSGPVIRSFGRGATRFVPVVRPASAEAPALTPVPLVTRCPRCKGDAGSGSTCARCGQPLGCRVECGDC